LLARLAVLHVVDCSATCKYWTNANEADRYKHISLLLTTLQKPEGLQTRNLQKINRLHAKLVFFVIVSYFHWLGQTRQLTKESVHYESVMFYGTNLLDCYRQFE
jgi:hypothetical protein